jgi:hypothetical protein
VIIELARANARTSETLIEQLGPILLAAAGRIDGGPAVRELAAPVVQVPTVVEVEAPPAPAGPWGLLNQMFAGAGPALGLLLNQYLLSKVLGLRPDQIAALGIQVPGASSPPSPSLPPQQAAPMVDPAPSNATTNPPVPPTPIDPNVQLAEVERLLTREEMATLLGHLRTLSGEEITAWRIRLCSVSAVDAAATIRAELAAIERRQAQGGVS